MAVLDPIHLTSIQYLLGMTSGILVGFVLGLIGGGGSILTVPLMVYLVGVPDPHIAIGTASVSVAVSAAVNLVLHARNGLVKWPCASVFAVAGMAGAALGSTLGKAMESRTLLGLFALLMIAVGISMLRKPGAGGGDPAIRLTSSNTPKLIGMGLSVGGLSGFFGIGGGFLIVPGLMRATNMPIINAVGSSLLSVTAFGATTAVSYGLSGWIDLPLAFAFVGGGMAGGFAGTKSAARLTARHGTLNTIFACLVFLVAAYMLYRGHQPA